MSLLRAVGAFVLLASAAASGSAQSTQVHTLESDVLGRSQTVTVHLPDSYELGDEFSYPVIYLLDGESNAGYAVAVADFLAEAEAAPDLITVAVHAGGTRTTDYLPTNPGGDPSMSGDADRFLEHLELELIPFIQSNYRAAPLRLLSGHSMGGVLVTHAMVTRPSLFHGYLAQSPYMVDGVAPAVLNRLETEIGAGLGGVFYFANVGDEPEIAPHFDRLEQLLSETSEDQVRWATEAEVGKTHMGTRLVGHYDGIERFFDGRLRFPAEQVAQQGIDGLHAYIDQLNSDFGYRVRLSEQSMQQAVQFLFSRQDLAGADAASALYVGYHPNSPISHFLRANAQAAGGATNDALISVERAITLFEANPRADMAPVYEGMKRLREALGGPA